MDSKLALLRIQLFTAMQQLTGPDITEFWELINEIVACMPPDSDNDGIG